MSISVVTGGAGFIGSHLVDLLLLEGHEVRVIDNLSGGHARNLEHHKTNSKLTFYDTDINDIPVDSEIFSGCNFCFHLAGIGDIVPSIQKPLDYFRTNTLGTINILEAARHSGVSKFVYASSSSCYGLADTPTTESHSINPLHPYAMSKYQGEQAVFHWSNVYGMSANAICIFNAYGPRVRTTGAYGAVFGVFFKQKLANKPFTVVGDGEQKRDFVYVTDVASSFLAAAYANTKGQRYNIGNSDPKSINNLVTLLGKNEVVYVPKRPGEPDITYACIDKAKVELGWKPKVNFEDGVAEMLKNIHQWQDAPLWDETSIAHATKDWFHYMTKS